MLSACVNAVEIVCIGVYKWAFCAQHVLLQEMSCVQRLAFIPRSQCQTPQSSHSQFVNFVSVIAHPSTLSTALIMKTTNS